MYDSEGKLRNDTKELINERIEEIKKGDIISTEEMRKKLLGENKMENELSKQDVIEMSSFTKRKGVVLTADEQHGFSDIFVDMSEAKEYYVDDGNDDTFFETEEEVIEHLKQRAK